MLRPGAGRRRRGGPDVLVHQNARRVARLDDRGRLLEFVVPDQPGRRAFEDGKVERSVTVEVGDVDRLDGTVELTLDEGQIKDPDDSRVDQVDQQWKPLAGHLVARELDHDVVDGASLCQVGS